MRKITEEAYLAAEREAATRSEFVGGNILPMAGASEAHRDITTNIASEMHSQFRGRPCKVWSSETRVNISATGAYVYPDIVAICGERLYKDEVRDTLLNPMVVMEVLSPSTERYDWGEKAALYRRLASLTDYVWVAQDKVHVEHYVRQSDDRWLLDEFRDFTDVLRLESLGIALSLAEIYAGVEFTAAAESSGDGLE